MRGFQKLVFYSFVLLFSITFSIDKGIHVFKVLQGSDVYVDFDYEDAEDDSETEDIKLKDSKSYFVSKEFSFKSSYQEPLAERKTIICNELCYASADHSQSFYSPPDVTIG